MVSSNSPIDWTKFMTTEDKREFLKSQEWRDWLIGLLNDDNKSTTVTFTKKDGTTRIMRCTRNPNLIPVEFHPKTESTDSGSSVRVFDLDKQEWRSFIAENVTHIDYDF